MKAQIVILSALITFDKGINEKMMLYRMIEMPW